ncbi:hypothetical protein JXO52_11605 [bacterium]|nr:hypothetical protein [bacterium]
MKRFLCCGMVIGLLTAGAVCTAQTSDSMLPLWKSLAEGKDLPSPIGFGVNLFHQDQSFHIMNAQLDVPSIGIGVIIPDDVAIRNRVTETNFRADVWILPFMNVFGIVGAIDGETQVDYEFLNEKLVVDYKGLVYGAGLTMAGGFNHYFASITATATNTKLDESESTAEAWILTPKIGVSMDGWRMMEGWALWIGAMYEKAEERHQGFTKITVDPLGELDVTYDITLGQKNAWNYLAGAAVVFTNNFVLELEGGVGDRMHGMASLIYRI